jgi:hypothetical protein
MPGLDVMAGHDHGEGAVNGGFRQSRVLLRIEAHLLPDGVLYRDRSLLRSIERKVRFEDIGDDVTRVFHVSRLYLLICVFFGVALLLRTYTFLTGDGVTPLQLAASVLYFALPVVGTWMTSPRLIGFPAAGGGLLFFERDRTDDPLPFLDHLRAAKQDYLRARYPQPDAAREPDTTPARGTTRDGHLLN